MKLEQNAAQGAARWHTALKFTCIMRGTLSQPSQAASSTRTCFTMRLRRDIASAVCFMKMLVICFLSRALLSVMVSGRSRSTQNHESWLHPTQTRSNYCLGAHSETVSGAAASARSTWRLADVLGCGSRTRRMRRWKHGRRRTRVILAAQFQKGRQSFLLGGWLLNGELVPSASQAGCATDKSFHRASFFEIYQRNGRVGMPRNIRCRDDESVSTNHWESFEVPACLYLHVCVLLTRRRQRHCFNRIK